MASNDFAQRFYKLRKNSGITQQQLGEMLGVSNRAVSKWECGMGYPDITLIPIIASLFGVTIDYLMLGEKKGIVVAGNIITDIVKSIESYPQCGMLTNVSDISCAIGGCAPNTAVDLAKIDRSLPVGVCGRVGKDENGRFIVSTLIRSGVDVERIVYSDAATSFCDVMSMPTGERTFFHKKGANAEFSPDDIDISSLNCEILHIGYILLLDRFDAPDEEYGTVMARFLHDVLEAGIRTSVDVVSSSGGDYAEKIIPALKYCSYAIMNEIECTSIFGTDPRKSDGSLNVPVIRDAMERMAECGVREKVIIHAKEAAFVLDCMSGEFSAIGSLIIPPSEIKGSVGAGDAFCAGCLYALHCGYSDMQLLEFASAAAACSLFSANSVDGMRQKNEIMKLYYQYERKPI